MTAKTGGEGGSVPEGSGRTGAVVLAAGKGTRMRSSKPKVVHELLHLPMLWYVHHALTGAVHSQRVWTVVGYGQEEVLAACTGYDGQFIHQAEQLGTGHAVQMAWPEVLTAGCEWCLVVNGDAPLIHAGSLRRLVRTCRAGHAALGFMSIELDDPAGYGRVVRGEDGSVLAVVEEKDLQSDASGMNLKEVNAGVYCLHVPTISGYWDQLNTDNAQGEYYLTDLVDVCVKAGQTVLAVNDGNDASFLGVNSPAELVRCERLLQERINSALLSKGVIIRNADQVRISPLATIHPGTEITGPAEIYGYSEIHAGTRIGSHVWIRDSVLHPDSVVREFSHLDRADVGTECQVGPYARLRPGATLKSRAKVGNFVEVKKAVLDAGCKVNHLSYVGDAYVGQGANIGAGTITCNYDGQSKHQTVIGKGAFIGSNTSLVAPVRIGEDSLVGAGSAVTKDVPEKTMAVTRAKQRMVPRRMVPGKDE